ncbi:DUF2785 domain-containing protein [Bacillus sp. APMAM]|nr:DUF2785 domain-containing protein [Bacillus sp. APMAM]RTZ54515.1 DUF2785 domain-containing protein [Bacillus sp. SAJ1]
MNLKEQLLIIKNMKDEEISLLNQDELVDMMLKYIGDTDSVLRDDLIYLTFCRLVENSLIGFSLMERILETSIGANYLFFQIGEVNSDSVFKRSFSALAVQLILNQDIEERFLSKELVEKSIQSSFHYLQKENDVRGFVEEKGWAHSIAHGADLLTTAISHPVFYPSQIPDALETIRSCLFKNGSYIDDEDERLIFAIDALLDKGLSDELLGDWLQRISSSLDEIFKMESYSFHFYRTRTNMMNFLKSLYFRLGFMDRGQESRVQIAHIIKRWHDVVYKR